MQTHNQPKSVHKIGRWWDSAHLYRAAEVPVGHVLLSRHAGSSTRNQDTSVYRRSFNVLSPGPVTPAMHGPRKRCRRKGGESAADAASPGQFDETSNVDLSPMCQTLAAYHRLPLALISGPDTAAGKGNTSPDSGALFAEGAWHRDEQMAPSLRCAHWCCPASISGCMRLGGVTRN